MGGGRWEALPLASLAVASDESDRDDRWLEQPGSSGLKICLKILANFFIPKTCKWIEEKPATKVMCLLYL